MNIKAREAAKRILDTFNDNYEITRKYAWYLEVCPTFINEEMMDELTRDGTISKKDAIVALLAELFGIDVDRSPKDRRLLRTYLSRSVRLLDTKKYTENPYYKNVKLPDVRVDNWEFKNEKYPAYRGMICDDLMLLDGFVEIPPLGFFEEDFYFPAVLEDGNEWMTLTPVDLDTSEEAIAEAHGRVVTFGLGLGYYVSMASRKPEVKSVTVVEKSEKVIKLFCDYVLPQLEHPEKIKIVCDDGVRYAKDIMTSENFDVAFVDMWRDASDGEYFYREFKKLEPCCKNTRFLYWIENFLISRCRSVRLDELIELIDEGCRKAPSSYDEIIAFLQDIPY